MKKYIEETRLKNAPDIIAIFTTLKEDKFAPTTRFVYKYPNQKLSYMSFTHDEDIERFLRYFAKKCNLTEQAISEKLMNSIIVKDLDTEYRVVSDKDCITFFAEKDEYSDCFSIKNSGVQTYTHGISFSEEDILKFEESCMNKK